MDLLADVAQHPAFRADDVDRGRKQRLVSIGQETDNVQSMAMRVGPKLVFGDSPYGQSASGTAESVRPMTSADITTSIASTTDRRIRRWCWSGDVTRADAERLARQYFGEWRRKRSGCARFPRRPRLSPRTWSS